MTRFRTLDLPPTETLESPVWPLGRRVLVEICFQAIVLSEKRNMPSRRRGQFGPYKHTYNFVVFVPSLPFSLTSWFEYLEASLFSDSDIFARRCANYVCACTQVIGTLLYRLPQMPGLPLSSWDKQRQRHHRHKLQHETRIYVQRSKCLCSFTPHSPAQSPNALIVTAHISIVLQPSGLSVLVTAHVGTSAH